MTLSAAPDLGDIIDGNECIHHDSSRFGYEHSFEGTALMARRTPPPDPDTGTFTPLHGSVHDHRPGADTLQPLHPRAHNTDSGPGAVGSKSGRYGSQINDYAHRNRKGR